MSNRLLEQSNILIVEDEPFIALDISYTLEDMGANVVGPATTVAAALGLINECLIDGAILDVNLPDGDIGPVIEMLQQRRKAMVIHTGAGMPDELKAKFPFVPVYSKPTPPPILARTLAANLSKH